MAAVDIGIIVTAVNNATAGIREVRGEIEGLGVASQETANRLKAIQVVIAGIVIGKITELTKSFLTGSAAVEVLQTRLALLNGNWQAAGHQLDEIITKYDRVGVSGEELAKVFVQLSSIGQSNDQALRLVDTIGKLVATTDRSPESIRSLGDALTKMLAKGTVDMRVLVTVLANQFPEAVRAAATAAHAASVQSFVEMAKEGQITSNKFLEFFQQGIQDKFGHIFDVTSGQLNTGLNRILNLWRDGIRKLNIDTPIGQEINQRLNAIADGFDHLISQITITQVKSFFATLDDIGTVLVGVGRTLGTVVPLFTALGAAVANLLAGLPPEVVTGGILGYLVYGRLGAAAAVIAIGVFSKLGVDVKGQVSEIVAYMSSNEALALGIVGLYFFGPAGGFAGAAIGAKLAALRAEVQQMKSGDKGGGVLPNGEPFGVAVVPPDLTKFNEALQNVQRTMSAMNAGTNVFDLISQKAREAGLTVEQTAALIAHAKAESDLGKNLVGDNGHSFGLFQFNDKGELKALEDFAEKGGQDWLKFGTQIDFVISRFKELGGTSTKTVEEASQVMNRFERFGDFLKNGDFGAESLKRMKEAQTILEQIANSKQVNVSQADLGMTDAQLKEFDSLKQTVSETQKQAEKLRLTLQGTAQEQAAGKIKGEFGPLLESINKNINALDAFQKKLGDQPTAQQEVLKALDAEKAKRDLLLGIQDKSVEREVSITNELVKQQQFQLQILQMKAREAELNLKLNFSNNAILNILSGTSGGQIVIQTEQQRVQLAQQIVGYELQIAQLEQQKIQTNDPALRDSIAKTQQMYRQLAADTQAALANLSASAVAQKQMWQSVGQALESGAVNAITNLVTHTGTLKDVTLQMYRAITQAAAKYLIQLIEIKALQPLLGSFGIGSGFGGLLGGLFAANGAVVPGGVKMFANGGIVGGPTLFGMMGEAGKEAIMPLTTVNGKLGVKAVGGGGDQYHIHISAIDTQTGVEFLMKNIQFIQRGLVARKQINRGQRFGDGMP